MFLTFFNLFFFNVLYIYDFQWTMNTFQLSQPIEALRTDSEDVISKLMSDDRVYMATVAVWLSTPRVGSGTIFETQPNPRKFWPDPTQPSSTLGNLKTI